jgi:ATP-dependent helicase/nuclease subunit A
MSVSKFQPTPEQLAAIHEVGGSVLVSAAAGSGKTAVLAERCAYLVCDAPAEQRCEVDQLLVLTFTEAAAAEMRGRIIDCIRSRLEANPADRRLREQMALTNASHISTIHSFCLWLIRRWFTEANVDPAAAVMDAEEAALLRREVLGRILGGLYAYAANPDDPLGVASLAAKEDESDAWSAQQWRLGGRDEPALAQAFLRLVDVYGLGSDSEIINFVLRLYDFTTSLPDWRAWLTQAVHMPALRPQEVVADVGRELRAEVEKQLEHIEQGMQRLVRGACKGNGRWPQLQHYAEHLRIWARALDVAAPENLAAELDLARKGIEQFEFPRAGSSRRGKVEDDGGVAAALLEQVREMFRDRLKRRFGYFTVAEWINGLRQTAPFIATICDLVTAMHREYTAEKRRLGVIDFADLERLAFDLLTQPAGSAPSSPSPIARELHRRFAYVLVDEFQDINPLQEAILRLGSREAAPELTDNLFAVGDIKQSIYRFRLAEPSIFADRLAAFRTETAGTGVQTGREKGKALFLQRNFRSRPELLDAVNLLFAALMNGAGGIVYDEQAMLRVGRELVDEVRREAIELHVIEKAITAGSNDTDSDDADEDGDNGGTDEPTEPRLADYANPANWTPIEREGYVIGQRILELVRGPVGTRNTDSATDVGAPRQGVGHPWQYRDIAILLRATKVNAERMAAMLSAMGIPAHAEVGGSLFAAREVRDVVAALQVLDNMQQDIPLAAALRSGIFGERFTPDELVEVRLFDPRARFHEAVRRCARRSALEGADTSISATLPVRGKDFRGSDSVNPDVRQRLADWLARIERYRERARRRPLSETLWAIYEDEGFLAHCAGLPNGAQRRANLIKLHDLARKFDSFRLQGLHRFLKFLESLEDERREVDVAPAVGEADNVVRIMSVHQSKGLEFPVVFVAGLGNAFNLGDRNGRMIFEREARIGLKVIDTEKMIDYPSAAHRLASIEVGRTSREEEMRILYVAMTRARDKLVLVGTRHGANSLSSLGTPAYPHGGSSPYSIATANCPLDWVLPLLHEHPDQTHVHQHCGEGQIATDVLFSLTLYAQAEVESWRAAEPASTDEQKLRAAVARLEPLPLEEPLAAEDDEVQQTLDRLSFTYPYLATTSVKATLSASGYKTAFEPEAVELSPRTARGFASYEFAPPPSKYIPLAADEPTQRGTVTHRVLEHLDFKKAAEPDGVASELQRMVLCGLLSEREVGALDQAALSWFACTALAARVAAAGTDYRRELRFVTTELVRDIDPSTTAPTEDRVLVRGIMDGIIVRPDALEVIDFKTDAVTAEDLEERAAHYQPQMEVYARAAARLWRQPVQSCHLVFLAPRVILTKEFAAPTAESVALGRMPPAAGQQVFPWMST